jgi:hypothetical protein
MTSDFIERRVAMKKVKQEEDEMYTFEEYKKKFCPPTVEDEGKFSDNPREVGIRLAEESLQQIKQLFQQK